jgi:hypothetical protein
MNDKELSNLDLDYLYSICNIDSDYKPQSVNIISTYDKDKINDQDSLENKNVDIFKNNGHCIIYHAWKTEGAHWLTLLRNKKNEVIIFDSLGNKEGMMQDKKQFNLLLKRLKENGFKTIIINDKQYQGNSNCCGKYAIFAIALNKLFKGVNIDQIHNHLEKHSSKNKNYDSYILKLFSKENI